MSATIAGQLELLAKGVDVDMRRPTSAQLGLAKVPPGAERLLAEMVKRGLDREHVDAAAALALELERAAR